MDDPNQARELIRAIRKAKHVDEGAGDDETAVDLTNALKMLSEELYSKPTHFILELIQNADDNIYGNAVTPKLTLLYRQDGSLWVGINELGFTEANVRAICRIAASTKKVENQRKGYIGEKGIGFKAVFKVADVVWVKSGAVSFKFDKNKPLGMIAPEWTDFPTNAAINERTMFCFRIPREDHRKIVQARILELKPELLLFLRQLWNVDVKVQRSSGTFEHAFSLGRCDSQVDSVRYTTLTHVATVPEAVSVSETFMLFKHTVSRMPAEPKRADVSESDVLIAFPIDAQGDPLLRDRMTFNFLPIRCYGLPFVLQADFMLSASREDILQDNEWNEALVAATLDLFVTSVDTFNKEGLVQLTWPRYVKPQGNPYGTVFQNFFRLLIVRLRSRDVLASLGNTWEAPSSLQTVPLIFTDGAVNPKPLMVDGTGLRTYVHASYDVEDLMELKIPAQSKDSFCSLVRKEASAKPKHSKFREKPDEWHSRLAQALLHVGVHRIRDVRLVPLDDGKWISSSNKPFYFAEISDGLTVPSGIKFATIDEASAQDSSRRRLFAELGAEFLSSTQVYQSILEQHRVLWQTKCTWTVEEVIKHAFFLYSAPSQPRGCKLSDLKLISESRKLRSGDTLYLDIPGSLFRVSDLFGKDNTVAEFIHGRYLEVSSASAWYSFLRDELAVNTLPKLLNDDKITISPEFQWLIDNKRSSIWLQLLRDHWNHYSNDLTRILIRSALSDAMVDCTDGVSRRLADTWLETESIAAETLAAGILPILAVNNPRDSHWLAFSLLGVGTRCSLQLYLNILKCLPDKRRLPPLSVIRKIHSNVEKTMGENRELVRSTFKETALVYLESAHSSRWESIDRCRWTAPDCLTTVAALSGRYSDLQGLFVDTLGVKNAGATDIAQALCRLSGFVTRVTEIKTLLIALGKRELGSTEEMTTALGLIVRGRAKIFPVREGSDSLRLCSANDLSWFIPETDRPMMQAAFAGKVAMLDLGGASELSAVKPLLNGLGLAARHLSGHVKEETHAVGKQVCHAGFTSALRAKAEYISRLVEKSHRGAALERLSTIDVWTSANMVLRRYVLVDGSRIFGNDERGWVLLENTGGSLRVYVSIATTVEGDMPYRQLSVLLMNTCGIKPDKEALLSTILSSKNVAMIQYELERAELIPDSETLLQSDAGPSASKAIVYEDSRTASPATDSSALLHAEQSGINSAFSAPGALACSMDRQTTTSRSRAGLASSSAERPSSSKSNKIASIDDASRIVHAASSLGSNTIGVLGASTASAGLGDLSFDTHDFLDMNTLSDSIPRVSGRSRGRVQRSGMSTESTRSVRAVSEEAKEWQLQIGYGGELFIFNFLKTTFQAGNGCWTSNVRERAGLSRFEPFEGEYADFTVDDLDVCQRITGWLTESGALDVSRTLVDDVKYHIECKTTVGAYDEPFSMSGNQVAMAKEWHGSHTDVYIILRVYDFRSSPKIYAYVDPHALRLEGKLSFTTQGSYYVQPA